jgi:hypothetical protein
MSRAGNTKQKRKGGFTLDQGEQKHLRDRPGIGYRDNPGSYSIKPTKSSPATATKMV